MPYMRLVHSTMTRAIQTAELIHEHIEHVPMESCELIREGEPVPPEPPFGIMKPESKGHAASSGGLGTHISGELQHHCRQHKSEREAVRAIHRRHWTFPQGIRDDWLVHSLFATPKGQIDFVFLFK
ncbi:hypothetical protein HPB48_011032 [Haemaphysalis longicornis]|uniref:Uncharacterized protein n=1 Tax=Haemaphysalis longicornis TaxID=44386 RepID=A0A9J6GNT6_HAELO|nr:hypothetical protein HPB48_011032 [Haemaphysalis longicornis]